MTSSSLIRMGLTTFFCVLALLSAVVDAKDIPIKRSIPKVAAKAQSKGATPNILEVVPINVAVYLGDNVTLTCAAVDDDFYRIQWLEFPYTGGDVISDGVAINPGHPQAARYTILQPTPQTFNLHIRDVQWADAGKYHCEDVFNGLPTVYRGSAQLIVIEDTPNCTTTLPENGIVLEDQYYTAECSLSYNGNIKPIQTWSGPKPFNNGSSEVPNSMWSGVSWMVNRTMDTGVFECLNNFTNNFIPPETWGSDHVPDWSYTFQTSQMFVYWGPKNMYAEQIKEFYEVGDVITCYADAFPLATYAWLNTRTNEEFHSQGFQVTEDLVGTTQQMRCEARNMIQGFVYSDNIFVNVTVLDYTTVGQTTPFPQTTPAVGSCSDLSGRWESMESFQASLCLTVDNTANGHTIGLFRNDSDTFWIEVVGRTELVNYEHVGFAGLWPGIVGVSGFVGECHRCNGVEVLLINDIQRTKGRDQCGVTGPLHYSPQYKFYRSGSACVADA